MNKLIAGLYKLKKGDGVFICGISHKVLRKEKTTTPEHKPLKETLIFLTGNKMVAVDINGFSVYKAINLNFLFFKFRFLWQMKNQEITF